MERERSVKWLESYNRKMDQKRRERRQKEFEAIRRRELMNEARAMAARQSSLGDSKLNIKSSMVAGTNTSILSDIELDS